MSAKPRVFHVNPQLPGETAVQSILRLEANLYNLTVVLDAEREDRRLEREAERSRIVAAAVLPVLPTPAPEPTPTLGRGVRVLNALKRMVGLSHRKE